MIIDCTMHLRWLVYIGLSMIQLKIINEIAKEFETDRIFRHTCFDAVKTPLQYFGCARAELHFKIPAEN